MSAAASDPSKPFHRLLPSDDPLPIAALTVATVLLAALALAMLVRYG